MRNSIQQSGQSARGGLANLLHDSFCCGLLLVDETGRLELVSPEASEALRIVGDLQGAKYHELPGGIASVLDQVRNTGEPLRNFRAQVQASTSDLAWLSISVIPVSENRPPALAVLLKYVTAAGKLEPDLRHLDRLATLGTLAASSAHEVKNALVAVSTFIDLLLEKNQDAELAGIVRSEMSRIGSIISRMLKLAAPTQGDFTRLQIEEVLERSLRLVSPQCEKQHVSIVKHLAPSALSFLGAEEALQQALMNLFLNAMDAMAHGGTLSVSTTVAQADSAGASSRSRILIVIQDTGPGISPEHISRLFEPFFTTKAHGTGLGLSITRRIIEEHGGSIAVESHPGNGTCFHVLLPMLETGPGDSTNAPASGRD
jgi:signal transduction histidine kinase